MAEIRPFKGLLYDADKIGADYSSVVAPPYDVISESQREELYEANEYNVIRLILGKDIEGDGGNSNKYARAKALLDKWQEEGVLARDKDDGFYVYLQEYEHKGKKFRRAGFIGLMKIGESAGDTLLPHEHTLAKHKEDRMNLIKQVEGNLSPIFSLYHDAEGKMKDVLEEGMAAAEPAIDITVDGERNAVWRISDPASINKMVSWMKGKNLFIADGHHRYEVARMYRDMRRREKGYDGSADHVMMYFTDMADPRDLTIMATHRAIKVMPAGEDEVISGLGKYFEVVTCADLSEMMEALEKGAARGHVFGYFGGKKYVLIRPRNRDKILGMITDNKKTEDWKNLDVSVLHSAIFEKILSVSGKEGNITYVKVPEEAEALVKNGNHMAAFFLNPTRVEQMKAVAEHGEMMPQKSTYFYPKLLSGLVINLFENAKVKA
jgi:uncharacterized protein (DUF1015 family)